MTSRDVVNIVQRRLKKTAKVGHAGTLDPLAEGVLVLGVGPAVRLVPYVQQLPKQYRASFRLGASTVSGDLEGEVTEHPDLPHPTQQQLHAAAESLVGMIQQQPPAHSAIWVDGRRAHKRIRAGEEFEMPLRTVRIDRLEILSYEYPDVELDILCGSGTYVRSLGMDLARTAGSVAVMSYLCRVAIGPFQRDNAVSVDQLRDDELQSMLVPPQVGVQHLPSIVVDETDAKRLSNGLCVDGHPDRPCEEAAAITGDGRLRAIVRRKRGQWCPYRVFPTPADNS